MMAELDEVLGSFGDGQEPELEQNQEPAADTQTVETEAGTTPEGEAATDDKDDLEGQTVPLKAHTELRKDRRELREKLEQKNQEFYSLREKIARLEGMQTQGQQPVEEVDLTEQYFEDPAGFTRNQVDARATKLSNEAINRSVTDAAELMKTMKEDAADNLNTFMEAAKSNPVLSSQFQEIAQRSGAQAVVFAYNQAAQIKAVGDNTSIDQLKENLRKEILAEMKQADPDVQLEKQQPPRSQAGLRAAGTNRGEAPVQDNLDGIFTNF